MAPTIYLHWTATGYDWIRPGHYHSIIGGDGQVHRLHAYSVDLPAHTWQRNSNSVALSCACMGGRADPWSIPPTQAQVEALCAETAALCREWRWDVEDITIERVMTHAEAASNLDGRVMHDNYGPMIWGGSGERWDFLQLEPNGSPNGGEQLRNRIREHLGLNQSSVVSLHQPLQFGGVTTIQARHVDLAVQLDAQGRSWALVSDLLEIYDISHRWDGDLRRILIGSLDVAPTYRADSVQASIGWPRFEMSLQSRDAPVILTGIVRPSQSGDRAWCRVVEFAEEFGISLTFQPLKLGERRGG